MKSISLKTQILASFLTVIFALGLCIAVLGYSVIKKDIIERAQRRVEHDLRSARTVYAGEIDRIGEAFRLVTFDTDFDQIQDRMRLHYLCSVNRSEIADAKSEIVRAAFERNKGVGGTRVIMADELERLGSNLKQTSAIPIVNTPMARPTTKKVLEDVMVKEYAVPVFDQTGNISSVIYGGRIINLDYSLVDRIRQLVFGEETYAGKPVGTVTIFQDDVRISTNVIDEQRQRAVGTRISDEVYEQVLKSGKIWHDRAFVVTDWYKTAYEPIKNIEGKIIGVLYVGMLEQPFDDMARKVIFLFMTIVAAATALGVVLAFVLSNTISRPLANLLNATRQLSGGDLGHRVCTNTSVPELNELAEAFNEMTAKLDERDRSLNISNEKLAKLNKSYLDLISFVAHELKGILSSAIMNAYSVRDGLLGMINFKQQRAMDSITRSLDYLAATVKKFLNLSRVEKGELELHKTMVMLRRDVFNVSVEAFVNQAQSKQIEIADSIPENVNVFCDMDLMQIVANNLVGNAVKYATAKGRICITCSEQGDKVQVEIYNDSVPITEAEKEKLFRRFSRLDRPDHKRIKGTGLGLFITKEIIERHGGSIWVEPRRQGNSFIFRIDRGLPEQKH